MQPHVPSRLMAPRVGRRRRRSSVCLCLPASWGGVGVLVSRERLVPCRTLPPSPPPSLSLGLVQRSCCCDCDMGRGVTAG